MADIDSVYQRLRAWGVTLAHGLGRPPDGPYRAFGVRAPEGNLLRFFGP
ncbi:hypothetical protein HPC49_21400 [Pyxidicoccus fallax]|uniref:Glyoxalase/fosfomycin resistance/dioxygenase domain-containing protein n=1 Tax=Pyxidicoccus fallax TaxID=394095 RepID=A0A848LIC7_9BACT|nr:VOC family protein [Pyxidicoccus fallax]NMO17472.1 hypothetical protein [Pyxidicoccus fallax]NPC80769.1 hypothetical protein [Pyxidicoccus fallax]